MIKTYRTLIVLRALSATVSHNEQATVPQPFQHVPHRQGLSCTYHH
jgi:hypothetical protein